MTVSIRHFPGDLVGPRDDGKFRLVWDDCCFSRDRGVYVMVGPAVNQPGTVTVISVIPPVPRRHQPPIAYVLVADLGRCGYVWSDQL